MREIELIINALEVAQFEIKQIANDPDHLSMHVDTALSAIREALDALRFMHGEFVTLKWDLEALAQTRKEKLSDVLRVLLNQDKDVLRSTVAFIISALNEIERAIAEQTIDNYQRAQSGNRASRQSGADNI